MNKLYKVVFMYKGSLCENHTHQPDMETVRKEVKSAWARGIKIVKIEEVNSV